MKINDFVEKELEMFRRECNFSDEEMMYFNLRAKDKSNVQIALEMNVSESKVSKLARKVKTKMIKVL
jgi:DNA-directed RNA polymerase specialized sigma subunit